MHDREEKGTYYGIYLRGTNFVMLRAKLDGKNEPVSELQRQEVQIPSSVMADTNSSKVCHVSIVNGQKTSLKSNGISPKHLILTYQS